MTAEKRVRMKVCVHVKSSSPQDSDPRKHDWRPTMCRKKNCHGLMIDCDHHIVRHIHDKEEVKKMISYLRKLKDEAEKHE